MDHQERWTYRIVILLIFVAICSSTSEKCKDIEKNIFSTANTLDKLLTFFNKHASKIELDGASAIVFGVGFLQFEIKRIRGTSLQSTGLQDLFTTMERRMEKIVNVSLESIKRNTPSYYYRFHKLFNGALRFSHKMHRLRHCPRWTKQFKNKSNEDKKEYSEDKGDSCFANVMGTSSISNNKCVSTVQCWRQMILPVYHGRGYTVTHGILYLLMMRKLGCSAPPGKSLTHLIHNFCCRVKFEFRKKLRSATLTNGEVDLLAEQAVTCESAGFRGFDSDHFYNIIVSMQSKSGCLGSNESKPHVGRRLLHSSDLGDGCDSHENGLVSAYLTLRLRHLVERFNKSCSS